MDNCCINHCEFLDENDNPGCRFYGLYLSIKDSKILRCDECVNDEKMWAIEQTIKEVGNGFI